MQKLTSPALLLALIFSAGITAIAQDNNPLINSGTLIDRGAALYDSGQYKKALPFYQQVDRNDTNYVRALYGMALCYEADSAYDAVIRCCRKGIALGTDVSREPELYNEYGNALNASGRGEWALRLFDTAIHKYPAYSLLYLNKATALTAMKRYAEAEAVYKQVLVIDPYSYSSHFKLGVVAMQEGKLIPAFLSFIGYLLMSPEGRYQSSCIGLLKAITHNEDEIQQYISARKETPSENYQLLEQIVQSKIALDNNYKLRIKLDDPICRQIQVVFEKMEYDEASDDFWNQFYIPFFKSTFTNGQFESLINHIFSGINLPAIKEYNQKNKKEIMAFEGQAIDYFNTIRSSREINYKKRNLDGLAWYFNNDRLVGKGKATNKGEKLLGPWEFYFAAGNISGTGTYDDQGKKQGQWTYYYDNGNIRGKEFYRDGKQENEETYYFRNGNTSSHAWYKDNQLSGEAISYNREGGVHYITHYVNGKEEGIKLTFYGGGDTSYLEHYAAGALNGAVQSWYRDGRIDFTAVYNNGKLDGPYKKYFTNGRLSEEGGYTKDKQEGTWKYYHENGKPKATLNFADGKQEGEYKEYFDNGALSYACVYNKGKVSGEAKYYDDDEKLFSVFVFENDQLKSARYYDKTGKQIGQSDRKSKMLALTSFLPEGVKKFDAVYNDKGNITGLETFYYPSGQTLETDEYSDGDEQGPSIGYYPNGKKKSETGYANAKKNGYHRSWYAHGQLQEEGWYRDNEAEGNWLAYDEQGALTDSIYYSDNDISGYRCEFSPNGKKEYESKYVAGWLEELTQYDSTGKVLQHFELPGGTGNYKLLYPDGKTYMETSYLHGNIKGPSTFYFPNGKPLTIKYYKNGLLDSIFRNYYYSGVLNSEGRYAAGEKTGIWTAHYPSGKLESKAEYEEGNLVNAEMEYFEDGKTDIETHYKDNNKEGTQKRYDPDGTLMYQLTFKDNKPVSYTYLDKSGHLLPETPIVHATAKIKTLFPNGNTAAEFEYKDGYLTGPHKLYYTNGQLRLTEMLEYDITEGSFKSYYPNGKPRHDYTYLHDNRNGLCKGYNDKGILTEEENYYNGQEHGIVKKYDDSGKLIETDFYYYGKLLAVKK